jgi:hypothetical protein
VNAWSKSLLPLVFLLTANVAAQDSSGANSGHFGGVIGRVFIDQDQDGKWSDGDQGLGKVRLETDTGEVVITDPSGRYHLYGLATGYEVLSGHVIKVDLSTIPYGLKPVGSPRRLFDLTPMGFSRQDFLFVAASQKAPEKRGIIDAKNLVPPVLKPAGDGQSLDYNLVGKVEEGCIIYHQDEQIKVDQAGVFSIEVSIKPGINQFFQTMHCPDGHLEFLLSEIHWVKKPGGSDMIVSLPAKTLASCLAPPPKVIPITPAIELICDQNANVKVSVNNKPAEKNKHIQLKIETGENQFPVEIQYGDNKPFKKTLTWKTSRFKWSGAILGTLVYRQGSDGGYIGGKLRGKLTGELPQGFKLILAGGLDSIENDELSLYNVLAPAWNPTIFKRSLDLELGYPVSADSSLISDDNPNSARYVLRIERKSSSLGWGSFNTGSDRIFEIGNYRRSLVGAFTHLRPLEDVFDQPNPTLDVSLEGFFARPDHPEHGNLPTVSSFVTANARSRPAHEEFMATGGTLYFLNHQWVVEGSERIVAVVRDARTGMNLEQRVLRRGIEYQVDWLSGRLMLTEPLDNGLLSQQAVRLSIMGSSTAVLVVDYEYVNTDQENLIDGVVGGRVGTTYRPAENVSIGGAFSMVSEGLEHSDYRLYKGEANAQLGKHIRLWASYGQSTGQVLTPYYSIDGGLSFANAVQPVSDSGEAYQAGASLGSEYIQMNVLFRRWLSGYGDTSLLVDRDLTQSLATFSSNPIRPLEIFGRFASTFTDQQGTEGTLLEGSFGLSYRIIDDLKITAQGTIDSADGAEFGDGKRILAGLKLVYRLSSWFSLLAGHQQTISSQGSGIAASDMTLTSLGGQLSLGEDTQLGLVGGWGKEVGNLVQLSLSESRKDGGLVFANTTFSLDQDAVRKSSLTTGQMVPDKSGVWVSTAETMTYERGQSSRGQQVGLHLPIGSHWWMKLAYERAELENPGSAEVRKQQYLSPFFDRGIWSLSGPGRRNVVFSRLSYLSKPLKVSLAGEYRVDEHLPLALQHDSPTTHRQTVLSMAARWMISRQFSLGGRIAWGETFGVENGSSQTGVAEGGFLEGSLGLVWRPENIDWLRLMLRTAAGRDLRPDVIRGTKLVGSIDKWFSGSFLVMLDPTKYFRPTFVISPWYKKYRVSNSSLPAQTGLLGMLRIGSEIIAGLGLAGEVRFGISDQGFETVPTVADNEFKTGFAGELFYLLENPDIGGVRFSVGYNFSDLPDPALLLPDLRSGYQGFFVRLEGMF